MGSHIKDWAEASGGMYMGTGTSWEVIWTGVAAGLCVLALIVGSRHELDAYKKIQEGKPVDEGPL